MSARDNKELIRRRFEEFAAIREDVAKMRAWCEDDFAPGLTYHSPSKDLTREETIKSWEPWIAAFSDMKMVIDDMVAERDRVMVRITFSGTSRGTFMGIPATGKSIVIEIVTIYRIAGGKIAEVWEYPDELGLMTQLGGGRQTALKDFTEKEFIKAENEAWENGDFRGLDRLLDPSIVLHMPPPLADLVGLEAVRQYVLGTRLAISNFSQHWQYLAGDGDVFALLRKTSGVYSSQVPGVPTGKEVTMEGLFVFRLKDGKVVEEWVRGGVTSSS